MGTVTTDRIIHSEWTIENHGAPGSFSASSRETGQQITIQVRGTGQLGFGAEGVELVHAGDGLILPSLIGIEQLVISAEHYPAHVAVNFTTLPLVLAAAPFLAGNDPSNPLFVQGLIITVDPSAGAGYPAPVGTTVGRNNAGAGELWLKTTAPDTGWTRVTVP
jgi:hypothetical protein